MFTKLLLAAGLALSLCSHLWAQVPAGKLWLLHEGPFGSNGAIGYVQYPANTYTQVTTMDGAGNDMLFHQNVLYAVGGGAPTNGSIFRIDTTTLQVLDTLKNMGARKLAVWDNKLLVTSYQSAKRFRVLDIANDYAELWSLGNDKLNAEAEAVWVEGNRAWVSMPGFFGDNNRIVVIDLLAQDTLATIAVPTNPNGLALIGAHMYVQSIDYGGLGLIMSRVDTATHVVLRSDTTYISTYGIFLPVGNKIWFGEVNDDVFRAERIRAFDVETNGVDNEIVFDKSQAPAAIGTVNLYGLAHYQGYSFISESDFTNPDSLMVWDASSATLLRSVGISARVLQFMPAPTSPTASLRAQPGLHLRAWPNPTTDQLTVQTAQPAQLTLRDLTGRVLLHTQGQTLSLAQLPAGVYLLQAQAAGYPTAQVRVVKH